MSGPTHGLLIRPLWLTAFLEGRKTWEIRSRSVQRRGPIALLAAGTGQVWATARLVEVLGPLSPEAFDEGVAGGALVGPEREALNYPRAYAWVLTEVRRLPVPVAYAHPQGAVIWVRLAPTVQAALTA